MNDWTIKEIQNLSASYIEGLNAEHIEVKGHNVCLVDLGGAWGYSALVTCEGRHIYHANDYQLHHYGRPDDELRGIYIEELNNKLFTDDELAQECDYDGLKAREHYIANYYSMRRECQSYWCYDKKDIKQWYKDEIDTVVFSRLAYAFYHEYDKDHVERMNELWDALQRANDPLRDYEHAFDAFKSEMFNHEYPINYQGDWDVIRLFANVDGDYAEDMLPKTGWGEDIIRAYYDAARYVKNHMDC